MYKFYSKINEKIKHIPAVKRARDYHLYLHNSKRILDLYLDDSNLIFGHKAKGFTKTIKNEMSKGLYFSLPSIYEKKILLFLSSLYKQYSFRIYNDFEKITQQLNKKLEMNIPYDFFYSFKNSEIFNGIKIIKKRALNNFFEVESNTEKTIILPNIPIPSDFKSYSIFFSKDLEEYFEENSVISQVKLFALSKSLSILRSIENQKEIKNRPKKHKIGENIKDFRKEHYSNFKVGEWIQDGCYIYLETNEANYDKIFYEALKNSILLNPYYKGLSTLPALISKNEKKKLENFLINCIIK